MHALEEGILDRFAEEMGMELLDDDVMRGIKERAERKREATAQAEAMKANLGVKEDSSRSMGGGDDGGGGGGSFKGGPGGGTAGTQWENAMARVLMMEQKAFFAQRPRMDPGRNLQPLPDVGTKKTSSSFSAAPQQKPPHR